MQSQKLYDNCERRHNMTSIQSMMMDRINLHNLKAFSSSDFLDLGNYKAVSKALEKLEDEGKTLRAKRGIYYLRNNNNIFKINEPPDIYEVAKAIARQYNWNIVPSGNFSLNLVGLSTQVPSKYIFISSGPYNKYKIDNIELIFKHSTSKEVSSLPLNILIAIQAIKSIGKEKISDHDMDKIISFLSNDEKLMILTNQIKITSWIYEKLRIAIKRA